MQLILISPDKDIPGEIGMLISMFKSGLQRYHLRKPGFTIDQYTACLKSIPLEFHQRIVITDFFELSNQFGIGGMHFNAHVRNANKSPELQAVSHTFTISTSFHSWQEIMDNHLPFDYVFISPVFNSISKPGYQGQVKLNDLRKVKQVIGFKASCPAIIGLGGVDQANIHFLADNGFDGAAVLGAVWLSDDPLEELKKIMNCINI